MIEWLVSLVFVPLTLAGDVCHLVRRKSGSLGESSSIHQVGDVVRLVQQDGSGESPFRASLWSGNLVGRFECEATSNTVRP